MPFLGHFRSGAHAGPALLEANGLAVFDDLKYAPGFKCFDYVNPDAPVGGILSHTAPQWQFNQNPNTFNTLNTFILNGDAPPLLEQTFASLMVRAEDEPDAVYGLLAKSVRRNREKTYYEFVLREEACFHDGSPLTAEDVLFSYEILKAEGHPLIASSLAQVEKMEMPGPRLVAVHLAPGVPRDIIFSVAGLPVLSRAYYGKTKFNTVTLQPPLGSGPLKVGRFAPGKFIEYERVAGWWGWNAPAMHGQLNFKTIRVEFYRDLDVAFEAFKAGQYFFREEFSSRIWATGYAFPAVDSGAVKRAEIPDGRPSGMQGFFINLRRDKLKDPRVRQALGLAFDFEWSNKNLFFDHYLRTQSVFQNSPMMANDRPSPDELALLDPFRGRVPDSVFDNAIIAPVSDGSGSDRKLLRQARSLLDEASVKVTPQGARLPNGEPFTLEILNDNPSFERILLPYLRNLRMIGVAANVRTVDAAQFQSRVASFDFDLVSRRYALGMTPGDDLRRLFGSRDADQPGSYNISGIRHPVVDELIKKIIAAQDRPALHVACRVLDRVLRSLYFWVPQWYRAKHLMAYWDIYQAPARKPAYASGIVETWWVDKERAKKLGKGL